MKIDSVVFNAMAASLGLRELAVLRRRSGNVLPVVNRSAEIDRWLHATGCRRESFDLIDTDMATQPAIDLQEMAARLQVLHDRISDLAGAGRSDPAAALSASLWQELADAVGGDGIMPYHDAITTHARQVFNGLIPEGSDRPDGWMALLSDYPVSARRVAGAWAGMSAHLIRLFQELRRAMVEDFPAFGIRSAMPSILVPGLGDPHEGHRQVSILEMSDGARVVHKPRSGWSDLAWARLTRRMAMRLGQGLPGTVIRDHGSHHWVSFITPSAVVDAGDYFRRLGNILALAHFSGLNDLHDENVIACADGPVIIDTETIFGGSLDPQDVDKWAGRFALSVMHTGALPLWRSYPDGLLRDNSLLGSAPLDGWGVRPAHSGVDGNMLDARSELAAMNHYPRRDGVAHSPWTHMASIEMGFVEAWEVMRTDRFFQNQLSLSAGRTRFVFRQTQTYHALSDALRHPSLAADGLAAGHYLDGLYAAILEGRYGVRPDLLPIVGAEQQALMRGDVPRLTADVITGRISEWDRALDVTMRSPGYQAAAQRLALAGDPREHALDLMLMRAKLVGVALPDPRADPGMRPPWAWTALLDRLAMLAVRARDGSWGLMQLSGIPEDNRPPEPFIEHASASGLLLLLFHILRRVGVDHPLLREAPDLILIRPETIHGNPTTEADAADMLYVMLQRSRSPREAHAALVWFWRETGYADLSASRAMSLSAVLDENGLCTLLPPALMLDLLFALAQVTGKQRHVYRLSKILENAWEQASLWDLLSCDGLLPLACCRALWLTGCDDPAVRLTFRVLMSEMSSGLEKWL